MSSLREEIKPLIIAGLHERRLEEFQKRFEKHNNRKPNKKEVNDFLAVVIASGNLDKEADELTEEFIRKAGKQSRVKNILFNTGYTVPACTIFILFIVFLLLGKVPDAFQKGAGFYASLISACILLLVAVIFTVISFITDKK